MVKLALILSLITRVLLGEQADAFDSIRLDDGVFQHLDDHRLITSVALSHAGYRAECIPPVAVANSQFDHHEFNYFSSNGPWFISLSNPSYVAAHHFDRNASHGPINNLTTASQSALAQGRVQMLLARRTMRLQVSAGDIEGAKKTLGQLLHTLQDFYAHSNYADTVDGLLPPDREMLDRVLLFDPDADEPQSFI